MSPLSAMLGASLLLVAMVPSTALPVFKIRAKNVKYRGEHLGDMELTTPEDFDNMFPGLVAKETDSSLIQHSANASASSGVFGTGQATEISAELEVEWHKIVFANFNAKGSYTTTQKPGSVIAIKSELGLGVYAGFKFASFFKAGVFAKASIECESEIKNTAINGGAFTFFKHMMACTLAMFGNPKILTRTDYEDFIESVNANRGAMLLGKDSNVKSDDWTAAFIKAALFKNHQAFIAEVKTLPYKDKNGKTIAQAMSARRGSNFFMSASHEGQLLEMKDGNLVFTEIDEHEEHSEKARFVQQHHASLLELEVKRKIDDGRDDMTDEEWEDQMVANEALGMETKHKRMSML